jgi:hypothetical protein
MEEGAKLVFKDIALHFLHGYVFELCHIAYRQHTFDDLLHSESKV